MGPGGRQGTLNDVWRFANWVKLIGLKCVPFQFLFLRTLTSYCTSPDPLLCKKFVTTCKQACEQVKEFEALTNSFNVTMRAEWEAMVKAWERNSENEPDPYLKLQDAGEWSMEYPISVG